ncbi:MAG: helix-turn-helix domain-containing protein [Maribacter sp.]|nr:helix-turn-helix domain-containing protein [Maribacter sp.]MBT8301654.1 helix-turn-helix domain-containing protein [Maribacter sp.]
MENSPDLNFQVLLDSIGLIQGVTLGILLIVLNRRRYRSSFFLGLFLLLYSLELALFISISPEISERFPKLYLLPFNFSWLLFPLFFLYTQQVSVLSSEKTKYWLLYPGIASFIMQVVIFCLPYETKQVIYLNNRWYDLFIWVLGSYYSWIIGIWNLRLLYRHRIEVKNTYSYVSFKELQWARILLIYLLLVSVFTHVLSYGYAKLFHYKVYLAIIDLFAIYWLSYFGIVQRNIISLQPNTMYPHNSPNVNERKQSSAIVPNKLEEIMAKIDGHMSQFESFINPDLTIMDLANDLKLHPKSVSTTINTRSNQNFNSYVNQFRIEKAKTLLTDQYSSHFSIEGIGKEVGFHSKSAFYSAFKKVTGTTPTKYKESIAV